jgi:hypothetical protein
MARRYEGQQLRREQDLNRERRRTQVRGRANSGAEQ